MTTNNNHGGPGRGQGRKPGSTKPDRKITRTRIALPASLWDWLYGEAGRTGQSVNGLVESAVMAEKRKREVEKMAQGRKGTGTMQPGTIVKSDYGIGILVDVAETSMPGRLVATIYLENGNCVETSSAIPHTPDSSEICKACSHHRIWHAGGRCNNACRCNCFS